VTEDTDDDPQEAEGSLEDQIAKELAAIKRPRKDHRFGTFIVLFALVIILSRFLL